MALIRLKSEFTYQSSSGGLSYYFIVGMDQAGQVSVRDIQSPAGKLVDSNTSIPQSVTDDIAAAIIQVRNLMGSSVVNGNLSFVAETSKSVTFSTPMAGTTYRVVFSVPDFIPVRVTSKTVGGFTVETGVTFTGTIGYDVLV